MNNTLSILSGIDQYIQPLQTAIYTYLLPKWGVTNTTYQAYGRSYRNKVNDGYRAEAFLNETVKEYGALIYNDKLSAMSFFAVLDPEPSIEGRSKANVAFFMLMDLSACKPNAANQMLDEQSINDVANYITKAGMGFTLKTIRRNPDHIFDIYSGQWKKDMIDKTARYPKFCFRLDITLPYNSLTNQYC